MILSNMNGGGKTNIILFYFLLLHWYKLDRDVDFACPSRNWSAVSFWQFNNSSYVIRQTSSWNRKWSGQKQWGRRQECSPNLRPAQLGCKGKEDMPDLYIDIKFAGRSVPPVLSWQELISKSHKRQDLARDGYIESTCCCVQGQGNLFTQSMLLHR